MSGGLEVVERCAYCDQPRASTCPACARPTCARHRPGGARAFCAQCEAEWAGRAERRSATTIALAVGAAAVTMAATFPVAAAIGSLALGILGGVFLPLPVSLVTAVVVERRLRRRFRPNPALPPATLRR